MGLFSRQRRARRNEEIEDVMAEKGYPGSSAPPAPMGDAPPSYDQSMSQAPPGAAGGFVQPNQSGYPKQGKEYLYHL